MLGSLSNAFGKDGRAADVQLTDGTSDKEHVLSVGEIQY